MGGKLLVGKIVSENLAVEKVNVLNDTSGKATVTNEQGFFYHSSKNRRCVGVFCG